MVYSANWVIIYHLPPIKGTRKLHWWWPFTPKMDMGWTPKMVVFTQQNPWGFLLKLISTWGVKWGYHHLRKHPYVSKMNLQIHVVSSQWNNVLLDFVGSSCCFLKHRWDDDETVPFRKSGDYDLSFLRMLFLTNQNFHEMESLVFHLSAAEGRHGATKVDVEVIRNK